jgi:hypothetical protein
MKENESPESVPSCAGEYGAPRAQNGPCNTCQVAKLCKKLTLAKKTLQTVLVKLEELSAVMKGEAAE